jgi:hypothetical protein
VTTVVRTFGGLDEEAWHRMRATVGVTALFGAHLVMLAAMADPAVDSHALAPLLLGTASLLVHHGLIRATAAYFDLAALEVLAALHVGFVAPSYLQRDDVIWVLLGIRALLVLVSGRVRSPLVGSRVNDWGAIVASIVVAHVVHHRPWSEAGLWAAFVLAVLTALVPRAGAVAASLAERGVVLLLLAMPAWLVHFASAPWAERGFLAVFATEPLLRTLVAVFLTGIAARTVRRWAPASAETPRPRAAHQVRSFLESHGEAVYATLLHVLSAACVMVLVAHYARAYTTVELALFLALLAGLAVAWYRRGRSRQSLADCLVAEAFAAATFGLLRRQLLLTTSIWTYEYDLWVSLGVSAILTGAKQRLERTEGANELKRPVTLSILAMPVLAIAWAITHHLGTDMVLLVVGLNTVLFAFLGHDRRDSPYNLVAVSGFVAFVLLVFWSKLELRVLHAYVLPVGIGVLLLLQLFEEEVGAVARARIRFVALLAMLASTGYHALLDPRHPLAFNLTLLLLCLGCMAVGSLVRIRLYVFLGLAVLLLDLASLAVKALMRMESQARMTWVGVGVFLLGALIVGMGVYHKARRREIEALLSRWRKSLGGWE